VSREEEKKKTKKSPARACRPPAVENVLKTDRQTEIAI